MRMAFFVGLALSLSMRLPLPLKAVLVFRSPVYHAMSNFDFQSWAVPDAAVYFIAGPPQAWAWTLLPPYLIFPTLYTVNNPNAIKNDSISAVVHQRQALSHPDREVNEL
ncbi:hypothetical protein BU15DRAFT_67193 [Melanogaster broomeanus]|nr:hypothetical protein BU15DRAFT_67193 [Melanogaster broomeanus]